MSDTNCAVCSVKSSCNRANIYLYAPTPILLEKLLILLDRRGLVFTARHQTVALVAGPQRDTVIEDLSRELSGPELRDLRVTFDLANLMNAVSMEQFGRRVDTQWFQEALEQDQFVYWFQPIVNAVEETILGHESLVRVRQTSPVESGEKPQWRNGQEIIDAAFDRGDIHLFDSYSRRHAILGAATQHQHGRVFINFTPSSIYDPAYCMASTLTAMESTPFAPRDIVFEVVESDRISNVKHLRRIAEYYRDRGFGFALDDVGTGSNSLQMIEEMNPDFIKLDKSLVWKCDTQIGNRTLRKLAELGAESGISVIAEGIETARMRDTLLEAGIYLMQGYFFGKPEPLMLQSFPCALRAGVNA